jgi:hypothetical protein
VTPTTNQVTVYNYCIVTRQNLLNYPYFVVQGIVSYAGKHIGIPAGVRKS